MNELEISAGLPPTPRYQYAQQVGVQLFLAGKVPHDAQGQLVGRDDPTVQAAQCLRNLGTLLEVHGFTTADIRRLVVYVVGEQSRLTAAWAAVVEYFSGVVPPATLLGVAGLGYEGQLVEVDATVMKA
jgi:enamine deaminase RidA (YjgF/YER057c/UK114 family)